MAKLFFFTDLHLRSKPPSYIPADVWREHTEQKIARIASIARKESPDLVIFGGDFFHSYSDRTRWAISLASSLISELFEASGSPVLVVYGQHDRFGRSTGSVAGSLEIMLSASDRMMDMPEYPETFEHSSGVRLSCIGYSSTIEHRIKLLQSSEVDCDVVAIHGPVAPGSPIPGLETIEPFEVPGVRFVLCGDMHVRFDVHAGATRWISPGSVLSVSKADVKRGVFSGAVAIVDTVEGSATIVDTTTDMDEKVLEFVLGRNTERAQRVCVGAVASTVEHLRPRLKGIEELLAESGYDQSFVRTLIRLSQSGQGKDDPHALAEFMARHSTGDEE